MREMEVPDHGQSVNFGRASLASLSLMPCSEHGVVKGLTQQAI